MEAILIPVIDYFNSITPRPTLSHRGSYVVFGKSEPLDQRSGPAFGDPGGGICTFPRQWSVLGL